MKLDRLIGILSILLQKEKVTAPYLAEKFEVSRRTINRDLEDIGKAGIPIVTTRGKNGGISIMDGYRMNRALFTSSDMQAILVGLKSLDSVSGTNRYQQLMAKVAADEALSVTDSNPIEIDLSSWHKASLTPKIEFIRKAIEQRDIISFDYYAPAGESCRQIEPYKLMFQWTSWYVWGYCLERRDYRMFKLNRLVGLKGTGETYLPRQLPEQQFRKEEIFIPNIQASILFNSDCKWRLIDEYGVDSFQEATDGRLLFRFVFSDKNSLYAWLLSFGDKAELISPKDLKEEFLFYIQRILYRYQ